MITVKMRVILLISCCVVAALFLFLSNHDYSTAEPKALIGKYCFNTKGHDSISILNDHTYLHKFITASGKEYQNIGTWKWNVDEIDFHDFTFYNNEGPSGGSGLWASKIENTDKEIRLIYSSENGIYYYKILTTQK